MCTSVFFSLHTRKDGVAADQDGGALGVIRFCGGNPVFAFGPVEFQMSVRQVIPRLALVYELSVINKIRSLILNINHLLH